MNNERIERLEEALRELIEHTQKCELDLDQFRGRGKYSGMICSDVLCRSRSALDGHAIINFKPPSIWSLLFGRKKELSF